LALATAPPTKAAGNITAESHVTALAEAWYTGLADLFPVTMSDSPPAQPPTNSATPTPP
jgi:hypothetical protein